MCLWWRASYARRILWYFVTRGIDNHVCYVEVSHSLILLFFQKFFEAMRFLVFFFPHVCGFVVSGCFGFFYNTKQYGGYKIGKEDGGVLSTVCPLSKMLPWAKMNVDEIVARFSCHCLHLPASASIPWRCANCEGVLSLPTAALDPGARERKTKGSCDTTARGGALRSLPHLKGKYQYSPRATRLVLISLWQVVVLLHHEKYWLAWLKKKY